MESPVLPQADVRHFIDLPRFGPFHYTDAEAITFPWGLPGFAGLRRFVVLSIPENERFIWLQSLDNVDVAIPLIDPWSVFADYAPPLPESAQRSLRIDSPADFSLLCVVVTENAGRDMYVNLLAPIVVNLRAMLGRQVLLEGTSYGVRAAVPKKREDAGDGDS